MANARIRGLTITIGGDTSDLVKALKGADTAIKNTQSNLRDINKALKFDPSNVALLKDKQNELAAAIKQTEDKLKTEREMLDKLKQSDGFDATSEKARALQTQIDLDTAALKQLQAQAKQSASVLGTQMQLAGEKIQAVGAKIKGVGDKITGLGQNLMNTVTVPVVGAFAASAKAAVDWETAFTGVQKTVDASAEDYDKLAENIKKMATETASSKTEIAGVMEVAGQLGITGVDGLTTFTKTMVELGDTTNMSAEEAATSLARFMNITGESATNVDRIGSAIVDLGNNFATSESEITEMATRLASAGTIAGMSSTDILALSAAMSSVGIQAEAGGTAMTQTLTAMTAAVADFEAGAGDDLEAIARVANMSAEDFASAWKSEPITAVKNFIAGLGELDKKGENATLVLDELGMSGVRQSNMLKSLSLASDVLTGAINTSSQAYKENTALSDEAAKRYGTMAAKMSQLKERITEVAIEIGETLMPYIEKGMQKVESLVEKWKGLDEEHKKAILKYAAIAAAIAPVLMIVGKLVSSIGGIVSLVGGAVKGFGSLLTTFTTLSGSTMSFSAVLGALASPIGAVVAAVAALVAGFAYLYTTNEEFRASVQQSVEMLRTQFAAALEAIKPHIETLKQAFSSLMTTLQPVFEFIFKFVVAVISGIIAEMQPIVETVTAIISTIDAMIKSFIALLNGDIFGFFEYQKLAFSSFQEVINGLINTFIAGILGFFQAFGINLQTLFLNIWNNIKIGVSTWLSNIVSLIQTKWNNIKTWLSTTLTNILEKFKEIFENIRKAVAEKIELVRSTIVSGIEKAVEYIKGLPAKFWQWGSDMVQSLIDGIKSKIEALKAAASELASNIAGYIHFSTPDVGALADADTYMPDFIDLLVNGINAGIPRIQSAMQGLSTSLSPTLDANMNGNAAGNYENTVNVTVYGAAGQDVSELADVIERRISENVLRRGAAFT